MGHGLQIWLQTMWFISRVDDNAIVILDEPDVYLHADLQRRLIRLLKQQRRQSIIATHSVEMISEVGPESVLIVDRKRRRSAFATTLPAVQKVIDAVGGVHNIHLARLWSSQKILFVEGKDATFLKRFQDLLFPESPEPLDTIPQISIGGWGGWNYAIGSSMLLRNAGGEEITAYCILDPDYHLEDEIERRRSQARDASVELHVWARKEIENYLVSAQIIERVLRLKLEGGAVPSIREIESAIQRFCDEMKDEIFDRHAEEYVRQKRPKEAVEGNRYARKRIATTWNSLQGKIKLADGKRLIASLSKWGQDNFGVSISTRDLLSQMRREDLDDELVQVITAIERCAPL